MQIDRSKGETLRLQALAGEVSGLQGPCVGCSNCSGLCSALIDTLVLPHVILSKSREPS
ncbi:hypothetical protein [Primorskyibacter sp. S87]|uniref:hypothetical protein n=1 Tax=Primorskyibacter sp. S87 TaxID=3415126 RepID=UPI003C7D8471